MTGTTRIPAAETTGLKSSLIKRFAQKMLGRVPSSLGVYWHNQKVLMGMAGIGGKVQKWDACDEQLKSFAHMADLRRPQPGRPGTDRRRGDHTPRTGRGRIVVCGPDNEEPRPHTVGALRG